MSESIAKDIGMWWTCGRKKKFKTKKKAEACAKEFNQKTYKCPYCGGYHTTSNK